MRIVTLENLEQRIYEIDLKKKGPIIKSMTLTVEEDRDALRIIKYLELNPYAQIITGPIGFILEDSIVKPEEGL